MIENSMSSEFGGKKFDVKQGGKEELSRVFVQRWKELILMVGRNQAQEHWKKQSSLSVILSFIT